MEKSPTYQMVNVTWLVVGIALLLIAIGLAIWAGFIYRQAVLDATNSATGIFIPMTFYILVGVALLLFIGAIVAMIYAFYYSPAVIVATMPTTVVDYASPPMISTQVSPCLT
jgi:hypothetical protein